MEIKFKEKEVEKILIDFVRERFLFSDKKVEAGERYGDYIITVSDWPKPSDGETEATDV